MAERDPIDRDVEREEAAAAEEAGRIGGRSGMEDVPEEERPLAESARAESEELRAGRGPARARPHADDPAAPRDRPDPEEPGGQRAVYADADSVESTETDVDTQGTPGDLDGSGEDGVPDTQT